MKTLSLLAAVLALGLTLTAGDADAARRFGGGKSSGMQREAIAPNHSMTPSPATSPAASPAARAPQSATAGAPPAAATPKRSWMGPLAGLAAGLGLAALASHFGFGGELASVLMFALLAVAVLMVIGFFMRRRASGGATAGNDGNLRYAAATTDNSPTMRNAGEMLLPASGSTSTPTSEHGNAVGHIGHIPANFDTATFVRNAKVNFIRLQAANDAGNLDDIRAFTTPEMFAEIKMAISERGATAQETDVVTIEADVLDVTQDATRHVVSVRFTGQIREEKNAAAEAVDEIWHMVKPLDGKSGWVVAGIQQMQ